MIELASQHKQKTSLILRERLEITQRCRYDSSFRELCRVRASLDVKWFINYWVTTYNPRVKPRIMPFILYSRQEECIDWILNCYAKGEWGAVVKCRYTGLSWICCALLTHKLLFERDFAGVLASNKAESVDKIGDPKALFEKILMIIRWLPPWMHEVNLDKHRKQMLIVNPSLNSVLSGESGADIGRGGRASMAVIDEFAHVEQDQSAIAALSENTDCAIFVSTPKGTGNKFYELATNKEISVFYYRWQADPRRTPEWRVKQTLKLGEAIAAQELDCDFNAAIEGILIEHKWIIACINAHEKIPKMDKGYIQAGLDVAAKGNDKTVLIIRDGGVVTGIQTIAGGYPTQTALTVHSILEPLKIDALCFDADGLGLDIAGTLDNLEIPPDYRIIEFHGAGKPSDRSWAGTEKTSQEIFANKRAEAWGLLAWRIKNTYEHLEGIKLHPVENLISIPDEPQLITDLSKPTVKYRGSKLILESKQEMRKRGISSPDYGDALAYCFYEEMDASWIGAI